MAGTEWLDVAIIGGGISGLYTAWRLSGAGAARPEKMALFELSERLGGRIDTATISIPGVNSRVEMGAMRFLKSHTLVTSLLAKLGLPQPEIFPGQTMRQLFLRGTQIQFNPDGSSANLPYRLAQGEPNNPIALTQQLLDAVIPNAFNISANDWEAAIRNATFQGRPLEDWGFWNVIENLTSNEAYDLLANGFGLQSVFTNINAAMAMRLISLPLHDYLQDQVFRPVQGWISLVEAVEAGINAVGACPIERGHRLIEISRTTRGIALTFETNDGARRTVEAGKVVLAMPKRSLDLLNVTALVSPAEFARKLSCVEGVPAFRLCVAYDEPWWQSMELPSISGPIHGFTDGYSYTDLPIRQVFYGLGLGSTTAQNGHVLMATYCDMDSTNFWTGLAKLGTKTRVLYCGGEYETEGLGPLIDSMNRQLQTLLGISTSLPNPSWVGFVDWKKDPYGGSWHEWLPGFNVLTEIPAMRHPFPDLPVYICGEAYSYFQGWIEGALMSAELLLQEHFSLPWPADWLDKDYSLGP